jgi:hypothetical protein
MMKKFVLLFFLFIIYQVTSAASMQLKEVAPPSLDKIETNPADLCVTAKSTLDYLKKGSSYDPQVIHPGRRFNISMQDIEKTLRFVCLHQTQMQDPTFVRNNFDFIKWYPDREKISHYGKRSKLVKNIPTDKVLVTRYYIHFAQGSLIESNNYPYAIYSLPEQEKFLSLEQASRDPALIRLRYGKQAILKGALKNEQVKPLAFFSREDIEAALMQGTIVAQIQGIQHIYNVHRNNNKPYDRLKIPYAQERYWYFKEAESFKGYGKDADYKINIKPQVTFAADINQLGLGKLLMIEYPSSQSKHIARLGILADTGGAFSNNLYQVDFLAGAYSSKEACYKAMISIPDYVNTYFLVLKKNHA